MTSKNEERESLLKGSAREGGAGPTYDGDTSPPSGTGAEGAKALQQQAASGGGSAGGKRPGARAHLQRNPSMEKVDEEDGDGLAAGLQRASAEARKEGHKLRAGCPDYFGVKSYLHHFYDTHFYKDPDIYEDEDDFRYLLNPHPRRRRCTSIWWKVFVWIGANFLVFGIIGVLVGYLVPQRPIVVGSFSDNIEIIDRGAITFNFNLDVCKLVGLILFCIGGLTLTVALLFPSFLYQYCEDDGRDSSFKVRVGEEEEEPLKSPLEMSIPTTTMVSSVQPERKNAESIVTQGGMVPMKD